jgi:hypothetical protein
MTQNGEPIAVIILFFPFTNSYVLKLSYLFSLGLICSACHLRENGPTLLKAQQILIDEPNFNSRDSTVEFVIHASQVPRNFPLGGEFSITTEKYYGKGYLYGYYTSRWKTREKTKLEINLSKETALTLESSVDSIKKADLIADILNEGDSIYSMQLRLFSPELGVLDSNCQRADFLDLGIAIWSKGERKYLPRKKICLVRDIK